VLSRFFRAGESATPKGSAMTSRGRLSVLYHRSESDTPDANRDRSRACRLARRVLLLSAFRGLKCKSDRRPTASTASRIKSNAARRHLRETLDLAKERTHESNRSQSRETRMRFVECDRLAPLRVFRYSNFARSLKNISRALVLLLLSLSLSLYLSGEYQR